MRQVEFFLISMFMIWFIASDKARKVRDVMFS